MHRIAGYLRPYLFRMCGGLTVKFIGSIMDLLLPYILAHIIDDVAPTRSVSMILWWGIVMIFCSVICVSFNIIANQMASSVARDTTRAVRRDLYHKIMTLSCRQTDEVGIPSLISRLTSDTYNLHNMIGMMQRLGVRAPILLLGGIIVTLLLDVRLAMV